MKFGKVFLVLGVTLALSGCIYSHGERSGVISKLSLKGLVCKTWEGELVMGGMKSTSNSNGDSMLSANIFAFTVEDKDVVEKIQAALESGERVSLVYDEYFAHSPCSGSTGYFIVDVK